MRLSLKHGSNALFIILEGIAFTTVYNLYYPFIQMFAKRMGAQDVHIALLNSIPPLVALFVLIPFSILIEKINKKKRTTSYLILFNSIFYALIAFVPFLPDRIKVIAYIIFIGLMNWPGSLYLTTWQSFFADTFTGTEANRVYSLRSKYGAFFGLLTVLLTGLVLTKLPKTDAGRLVIYQFFYGACFLISLLQIYFLNRVRELKIEDNNPENNNNSGNDNNHENDNSSKGDKSAESNKNKRQLSFGRADIKEIFQNKGFVTFCGCAFLFHVTWQMGWPLFFIYNVDIAHFNEFQLSIVNVAAGLVQFMTYSMWNRVIDKKGSRFVILLGAFTLAVNPLFYTKAFGFYYVVAVNILIGIGSTGFTLSLFSSLLETLPETKKTIYISVFNTLINISGFVSPLIGVWVYKYLDIFATMFLIGLLRIAATSTFAVRWWRWRKSVKGAVKEAA